MRGGRLPVTMRSVGHRGIHLTIELDAGAGVVAGQISADGGEHRAFTGYAELIAAIEGIRAGAPAGAGEAKAAQ